MTILAPRMILNLRREYYGTTSVIELVASATAPSPEMSWHAHRQEGTVQVNTQVSGSGIWSAEMGGYVVGRHVISQIEGVDEE